MVTGVNSALLDVKGANKPTTVSIVPVLKVFSSNFLMFLYTLLVKEGKTQKLTSDTMLLESSLAQNMNPIIMLLASMKRLSIALRFCRRTIIFTIVHVRSYMYITYGC